MIHTHEDTHGMSLLNTQQQQQHANLQHADLDNKATRYVAYLSGL